MISVKGYLTDTYRIFYSVIANSGNQLVQYRRRRLPQLRVFHLSGQGDHRFFTGCYCNGFFQNRSLFPILGQQTVTEGRFCIFSGVVFHLRLYCNICTAVCNRINGEEHAVMGKAYRFGCLNGNLPIDSAAGKPARIRQIFPLHSDTEYIFRLAKSHKISDIQGDFGISIRVTAQIIAVAPDFCILINTVKNNADPFSFVLF